MEEELAHEPATRDTEIENSKNKRKKTNIIIVATIVLLIIGILSWLIYSYAHKPTDKEDAVPQDISKTPEVKEKKPAVVSSYKSEFATYRETPVTFNPQVPTYTIKKDLSNVANNSLYSENAKKMIARNGFVVKESYYREFFPLYEENRYKYVPNFITTDSMLHNYHLMFDFLLKQLEEQKLASSLKLLNANMLSESLKYYEKAHGTSWENAAKRNVGFFAVGSILLDPSVKVPSLVKDEVAQELALIEQHQGISESPVMNIGNDGDILREDYSQYIPRGHYDKTDQLKAYFKSMMWYGRLTFRMKNNDEVKSALLITLALNNEENFDYWNTIYEPINFFVGKSDDITYYQFKEIVLKIYGNNVDIDSLRNNESKFLSFVKSTQELKPPQINSMPIFNTSIQPDREQEIKGFRFMGQRFTIDAAIFQRLVTREIGPKGESCSSAPFSEGRMLPKGLDIPSALGSDEAFSILQAQGETDYACYKENMSKMRSYIADLKPEHWTQNLYWGWLYQLQPLLSEKPSGYPVFMLNQAWKRKELNTFLGSWTELKHDTILYSKQVYAEMGGGNPEEKDDRGYVEPNPYLYARLSALVKMTMEGLEVRDLLTASMKENLGTLHTLALSLKTISEKELNNEKLSDEEYELIRSYGGQLEHFWIEVNKDEPLYKEAGQHHYLYANPSALIADVATDPNGEVLEEATGKVFEIFVVVPIDGKLRIAKGGIYSYYEFTWPMSDRLTDDKWRNMLDMQENPPLPEWTNLFIATD